jgi:hypothetical protein
MWLNYSDCSFGAGQQTWTGTKALIASTGSVACGSFPAVAGSSGTLTRQFVAAASSTTPATASVTLGSTGDSIVMDDASSNLSNYNGDTIATVVNGGYGQQVTFSSGARTALTLDRRIYVSGKYDHSLEGSLSISETAGASQRTVTGSVTMYHNLLKIIGTAQFNSVVHSDTCCQPISGSITTTFSAATTGNQVAPTTAGAKLVGKSETLTFTGCGTATLQDTRGNTSNVTISRCF